MGIETGEDYVRINILYVVYTYTVYTPEYYVALMQLLIISLRERVLVSDICETLPCRNLDGDMVGPYKVSQGYELGQNN